MLWIIYRLVSIKTVHYLIWIAICIPLILKTAGYVNFSFFIGLALREAEYFLQNFDSAFFD